MDGGKFYSFMRTPLLEMSLLLAASGASTEMGLFAVHFLSPIAAHSPQCSFLQHYRDSVKPNYLGW